MKIKTKITSIQNIKIRINYKILKIDKMKNKILI